MSVFSFDPADYRDQYLEQGYVHVAGGVDPEFLEELRRFTEREFSAHHVEGRSITGEKDQAVFRFSDETQLTGEVFDVVAGLCGLDRDGMTLSERHIKAYKPDAEPEPVAHKDRFSSQVSVGLSIDIPASSRLVLYPDDHRADNPFNVARALRESLEPDEQPEVALKGAREVAIADRPGDVVFFPGRSMWHLRRNSANATNLYLKFNDFGSDPLGEDPATGRRREATLALIGDASNGIEQHVPVASRRLDTIVRQYTREWNQVVQANVWEERPLTLTESEVQILRLADGRRTLRSLVEEMPTNGRSVEASVRRLAEHGALDLLAPR